jgi:hypothetical protein
MAALPSPKMQEGEAASVAAGRQVGEDILRFIANERGWVRLYKANLNLCFNPKTPVGASLEMPVHLRDAELRQIESTVDRRQVGASSVSSMRRDLVDAREMRARKRWRRTPWRISNVAWRQTPRPFSYNAAHARTNRSSNSIGETGATPCTM